MILPNHMIVKYADIEDKSLVYLQLIQNKKQILPKEKK
jgi:hypothetical protein